MAQDKTEINAQDPVASQHTARPPRLEDYARIWTKSLLVGDYNRACRLELDAYNTCIKPTESLAAWNEWQARTAPQRLLLSNYYCRAFPSGEQTANGRVAIVLHNFSGLAHEVQFGRQLKKVLKEFINLKAFIVYAFGEPARTKEAADIYGVNEADIVFLQAKSYLHAAASLEAFLGKFRVGTVVYPSITFFCFWMSLICRHANQKFFQMKYFPRQIGRISEWAGYDDGGIQGKRFVAGEGFTKLPVDLLGLPRVSVTRKALAPGCIRFGSISRIEKIQNPEYVSFVVRILEMLPEAECLVTGRTEDQARVPTELRLHPRVSFVGWVKPEDLISQLDIYLDPWPWGGGDMSFLAMVNGLPYLTLATPDGMAVGPLATIRSLVTQSSVADVLRSYLPDDQDSLLEVFKELAINASARAAAGANWNLACSEAGSMDAEAWRRFLFE